VVYQWVDCDRYTVSRRYDRLATYIPLFDRILFLPKDSRRKAVDRLGLRAGDRVLDVGCGTGRSLGYLHKAVGPTGRVYGIDISAGMLRKAQKLLRRQWLGQCRADAMRCCGVHGADAA
jgi:ubiquinone/menaquinone biosynthesis C-methylase UbiE